MSPEETKIVIDALHSAFTCLSGNPMFEVEERQVRKALRVMGVRIVDSAGAPITEPPYIDEPCTSCGDNDRVLRDWQHDDRIYVRLCTACRRRIMREAK